MRTFIHALIIVLGLVGAANAVEIQRWERIPLAVPLIVGAERIIFVDQNIRVGVPKSLTGKLRIQSTGGSLYLMASEPIAPTRLQLQNVSSGEIILVDIAAAPAKPNQAALEPIRIVAESDQSKRYGQTAKRASKPSTKSSGSNESGETSPATSQETPVPVVITRYAAQMLYAPLRTVEPVKGISPVRISKRLDLSSLAPTYPVKASVLGAWRMANYWVTAVKLENTSTGHLVLDPRELMGDFVAATFQHPYLGVKGEPSDTTVAYLVTKGRGLDRSLLPSSIAQIDPKGGSREE